MNEIPIPRTDAIDNIDARLLATATAWDKFSDIVSEVYGRLLDFTRQLERELQQVREELEKLKQSEYQMQLARFLVANHELKQQVEALKTDKERLILAITARNIKQSPTDAAARQKGEV